MNFRQFLRRKILHTYFYDIRGVIDKGLNVGGCLKSPESATLPPLQYIVGG
jgi:hypothetical protein